MTLDVIRPEATGVVGQAVNGGDGWLVEGSVAGERLWVKGTVIVDGSTLPVWTDNRNQAVWWQRPTAARAWAEQHLTATRGGKYDVTRTQFPTGFSG